jgi:hypothetical protein
MLLSFLQPFPSIVTAATRSFWKAFLHGLAWVLFAIAGLAFWVGGRAISEFGKIDRILAEMLGLLIAAATGALGYVLKNFSDDLRSDQDSPGQ